MLIALLVFTLIFIGSSIINLRMVIKEENKISSIIVLGILIISGSACAWILHGKSEIGVIIYSILAILSAMVDIINDIIKKIRYKLWK